MKGKLKNQEEQLLDYQQNCLKLQQKMQECRDGIASDEPQKMALNQLKKHPTAYLQENQNNMKQQIQQIVRKYCSDHLDGQPGVQNLMYYYSKNESGELARSVNKRVMTIWSSNIKKKYPKIFQEAMIKIQKFRRKTTSQVHKSLKFFFCCLEQARTTLQFYEQFVSIVLVDTKYKQNKKQKNYQSSKQIIKQEIEFLKDVALCFQNDLNKLNPLIYAYVRNTNEEKAKLNKMGNCRTYIELKQTAILLNQQYNLQIDSYKINIYIPPPRKIRRIKRIQDDLQNNIQAQVQQENPFQN